MAFTLLPDQGTLRQLLDYEPLSGKLFWKFRPAEMFSDDHLSASTRAKTWNARFAGREAFTAKHCNGYRHGTLGGNNYLAHRVIWMLVHGSQPKIIDHANGVKTDNRIVNLRSGSHADNAHNMPMLCNNRSGHTGVYVCNSTGRWRASLMVSGKMVHLGRFVNFEDAVAARQAAERDFGFHVNHGRSP